MRSFRVLAALCLIAFGVKAHAQDEYLTPDAKVPTAAQHAFEQGRDFEKRRQLSAAVDSYQAAMKASGSECDACLSALYRTQIKMEEFKAAAQTATLMTKYAPDNAGKAEASAREGDALYQLYFALLDGRDQYDKSPRKAQAALAEAASAMDRASAADPTNERIHMLRAHVLASLNRDKDASAEFTACAAMPGISEQECTRAKRFAQNVAIARNEAAPNFKLTTIDGKPVSLDSLAGKIVLIDFWATWCSVCARDEDYVQSMYDMFDKDKFVLLKVSGDSNSERWKNFVADNRLEGVHTRDEGGQVSEAFHVSGFPTYIILDGDGVMRLRAVGIDGDLKGTVNKLLSEQKASAGKPFASGVAAGR
jgi:peroxiredoxin